ncbi:hypothetical protein AGMMS50212_01640 [Spirochaetia bacterium]|nr:hypothetical protein AGMMS50212_01640 [Spirochaetia bacterium]
MQEKIKFDECYQCFYYLLYKRAEKEFKPAQGDKGKYPPVNLFSYENGLKRFGDEGVFLSIVKSYVDSTPALLTQTKFVNSKTLKDYAVIVHGIKSSSRAIGAEIIGQKAEELEHAAKAGRLGYAMTGNIIFQELAEMLIQELQTLLNEKSELLKPLQKAEPDRVLLIEILDAAEHYDMSRIDAAMEELERYIYDSKNDLIEALREKINMSDLENVKKLLENVNDE